MSENTKKCEVDSVDSSPVFDPWSSTLEDAIKANEANPEDTGSCSPISQWYAVQRIERERELINRGDGFAVLACVRSILTNGLVAPKWLSYEFNKRYDLVLNCLTDSWDDPKSFGRPYKKGKHINSLRKERILKPQLQNIVSSILQAEPHTPIDAALFERAGQLSKPPVGKTEAERIYRIAKKESDIILYGKLSPAKTRRFAGIKRTRR